ncbi:MAG TPA: SMC-Scp complex subunit ScpB [Candidatus Syntrophoarchaeum butanivorans]|uniref:Prokaryotic chromosome segregation and condensation protein ScpB n=3 Tax=Candidatus Syntropharchaeum butanivorans TaxID=1839936 RepID=A0A1F2P6F1_9EURY|nr:MAG: Prokaryotic chromosome segregation and condensation protein ScpB [Candidatus Syntrophoarchaeum butanivorans]RJS70993.1 MAG: SMC-Scp complex subunit ScpB [Candidatus Syntrophoarchaeum sp. WYZ-LMO15]RLI03010.1 MAG: SMC-Scp complex subunit ScpB [Candidatus Bathyarchaeota archaeon]HDM36414.1 SMC-Scp complex subunit ScpB [Candidatus Syntrophoarchaeum butanivorans]
MKEGEVRARQIIEAALFISGSPLSSSRLARLAGLEEDEVEPILEELRSAYESRSSAIVIERSDDGWVMEVRKELGRELSEIVPRELDTPTLRTLAVIAYRQPITQSDLVKVRGKVAYRHVKELETRGFVESKPHGHTKMLRTTKKFREYFEVEGIDDLFRRE